jgi:hyperosmotically inducible periplasmic protein
MTTRTRFLFLATTLAGVTMIAACNKPADPLGPAPTGAATPNAPMPGATPPSTTVGAETSDAAVTAKVKAALLMAENVKSLDISVETVKGDVKLTGFANTQAQIDEAIKVARSVKGVQNVQPDLSIKK